MKKIFIPAMSAVLICLATSSRADLGEEIRIGLNNAAYNTTETLRRWKDGISAKAHTLIERDHDNYWLNNIRTYKSYPINYYNGNGWKYDSNKEREEVATREYKHNTVVSANLGQRMLDSETFTVTLHNNSPRYQPTTDVTFYNPGGELKLTTDDELAPIGEVKIEGIYYLLFDPREDGRIVMIDDTGRFIHQINRIYQEELVISREITNVTPKKARVEQISGVKQTTGAPKFNFEIRYDGLEDGKMSFRYITSENGGQSLRFSYPEAQKVINIYGNKIQIIKPYKDKIEYMILD